MNSSGIKRGLAVSAISALAITGVPAVAFADSYADQLANAEVRLYSQYSGGASVQNDGTGTTVHLLAGGGEDVAQIQFQYQPAGAADPINIGGPVSRSNGVFSLEWAPPSSVLNIPGTQVIAQPLSSVGTPIAGAADTRTVTVSGNVPAVDISNAAGSTVGVFRQPYGTEADTVDDNETGAHNFDLGIVSGTTSATGDADTIELRNLTTGEPTGSTTPGVQGIIREPAANGVRAFKGSVDFTGYNFDTTAPVVNEAIVGARVGDTLADSDDAEAVDLVEQTITTVTAAPGQTQVAGNNATTGNVTVLDQFGNAVRGAQVIYDVDNDGVWDAGTDGEYYTNNNGVAVIPGLTGDADGTSYSFFVNTTDGDDFDPAVDFRRTITVSNFDQVATTIEANSVDGAAFDVNEYALGDITVTVEDQQGNGLAGQTVQYQWTFTAYPTTATPNPAPVVTNGSATTTGADGEANIPLPANYQNQSGTYVLQYFINRDGTPGQGAGDLSGAPLTVEAGDSTLAFDDAQAAAAGSTATYTATLRLPDGTPLPGRAVRFTYAPNGDDVVVAAQANQPAGTTRVSDTAADDVTDANGAVQVALSDPANTPPRSELDGMLDAVTQAGTVDNDNAAEDADAIEVDFVTNAGPAGSTVVITEDNDVVRPGEANAGTAVVTRPGATSTDPRVAVEGVGVTLTISEGFFTDGTIDEGAAAGEDAPQLNSLGQTITVVSGPGGVVDFQTAIERSEQFDNDGLAEAVVTAAISGSTDTEDFDYTSANPFNGGTLELVQSPNSEQANPVDPTLAGNEVAFDVFTRDGYGNLVGNEPVVVTDSSDAATVSANTRSDFEADGDFTVTSTEAGTVTVTGRWTTETTKYAADGIDLGTELDTVTGTETLEDSAQAEFYEVNFAEAQSTIRNSTGGRADVNELVTETVTVRDQEGRPIEGLTVNFLRSGPGEQDGDINFTTFTDENGVATYNFIGTQAGTANISAVVRQADGTQVATLQDQVVFAEEDTTTPPPVRRSPEGFLNGYNNGGRGDNMKVNARGYAAGARVNIFRKTPRGLVFVRGSVLNEKGDHLFANIFDRNGRGFTNYVAFIKGTNDTLQQRTNFKRVR